MGYRKTIRPIAKRLVHPCENLAIERILAAGKPTKRLLATYAQRNRITDRGAYEGTQGMCNARESRPVRFSLSFLLRSALFLNPSESVESLL